MDYEQPEQWPPALAMPLGGSVIGLLDVTTGAF
jgi:hypothetical protein